MTPFNTPEKSSNNYGLQRLPLTILAICFFMMSAGCSTLKPPASSPHRDESPLIGIIRIYQGPLDHLSIIKHGECPMYPSCSEYAIEAIRKHGALIGWIMTCDRLMRCGRDEVELSPEVLINGNWKTYDTVAANDWWWYGKEQNRNNAEIQNLKPSPEWEISIQ